MNAPKLELFVGILQVLADNGQLSAANIATKVKIDRNLLERCIKLLVEQEMVSETKKSNLSVYDIAKGGKKVLKFFRLENPPKTDMNLSSAYLVDHPHRLKP